LALSDLGAQVVIMDHELRFTPAFLCARNHLRRGSVGAVLAVEAAVMFPMREKAFSWWNVAELGGGALGAMGSHIVDAFRCAELSLSASRPFNVACLGCTAEIVKPSSLCFAARGFAYFCAWFSFAVVTSDALRFMPCC
jgi:hypothetical protein